MKKIISTTLMVTFFAIANSQSGRTEIKDAHDKYANVEVQYLTTTKLPNGTVLRKGKVMLKKGYTASYADNNQIIVVYKKKDGSVTGSFTCYCKQGGSCTPHMEYAAVVCRPKECIDCQISIALPQPKNIALTKATLNWKILDTGSPAPEDPDQGGEIFNNKDLPVKQ